MKHLIALILTVSLFLYACSIVSWEPDPSLCRAWWTGEINDVFVEKAQTDLERVQLNGCRLVTIALNSPGGYVTDGLEVIRLMRKARAEDMIVSVHGGAVVASMAILVMAAGTPGYRYTDPHTLVVVHGPRGQATPFEPATCLAVVLNPTTEEDRVLNQIINTMIAVLVENTGRAWHEVSAWFECGQEQVGDGSLLIVLGVADAIKG